MLDINYVISKYSKLVYKICYDMTNSSYDAEDIMQETFLSLYKNTSKYGNLEENDLKNLICKIALNKCKDFFKSKIHKQDLVTIIDSDILESYIEQNSIYEEIYQRQRDNLTISAINRLKEPYRSLINDYYIKGLCLDELSVKYKKDKNVIKTQLYRGKIKLKKIIDSKGGIDLL